MKPSATGRILFWRGGSLWIGLAGEPAEFHAHHAVQIALAFPPGRVRFQTPTSNWEVYHAAIVAAEQTHAFEARGQWVAQIFADPESREGRELQLRYSARGIAELNAASLQPEIAALATGYARQDGDATLTALARRVIAKLAGAEAVSSEPADRRVTHAIELIRAGLGDSISLEVLAAAVHLSTDRFRHLFIEETGVGLRPYVLWLRLERALGDYIAGSTLTDAAHAAGFADSAHFSRTFKRMFGISPASVRPE